MPTESVAWLRERLGIDVANLLPRNVDDPRRKP
jgi:hypothetical protein